MLYDFCSQLLSQIHVEKEMLLLKALFETDPKHAKYWIYAEL